MVQKGESRSKTRSKLIGVAILAALSLIVIFPGQVDTGITWFNKKTNLGVPALPNKGFSLGLDLQGGASLIYQADTTNVPAADQADAVAGVRDIIERRVEGGLGVSEADVETTRVNNQYRILVQLPGVANVNQAISLIGQTPILNFEVANTTTPSTTLSAAQQKQLDDYNAAAQKKAATALAAIKNGMTFSDAVKQYSEDSTTTIAASGDLGFITETTQPELYDWAKTHTVGQLSSEPIATGDGLNIVKYLAVRDGAPEVDLSDIQICWQGLSNCTSSSTKAQAEAFINTLKTQATPANFASLAKQYSTDGASKADGGELGAYTKDDLSSAFADPVWNAPTGTIVGPIMAADGYYLVYKKPTTTPKEYDVARVLVKLETKEDLLPPPSQWTPTQLSGKQLQRADVTENSQTGEVEVSLQFNAEGTQLFSDITAANVGKQVAIFLDGQPISEPVVNEPITNGNAVIQGNFSYNDAHLLAQRLNSGALPVPVQLLSQQTVDATLGADSLAKSFKAGLAGLILVMIFMAIYYRLPGLLAVVSLAIYTIVNLALFKVFSVTLTLAGIAGFILSIGMAVDANVLVFERLKEELRFGKTLSSAMEESFIRAWPSIRDGHVTTLISCLVLTWFGTGFVQGFAVVLGLGTLVSLFTAITVTRTIMRIVFSWFGDTANALFLGYRSKSK